MKNIKTGLIKIDNFIINTKHYLNPGYKNPDKTLFGKVPLEKWNGKSVPIISTCPKFYGAHEVPA